MSAPTITPALHRGEHLEILVNGEWEHAFAMGEGVVQPDHGHPFRLTADFETRPLPARAAPCHWLSIEAAAIRLRTTETQVLHLAFGDRKLCGRWVADHYEISKASLYRFMDSRVASLRGDR